MKSRQNLSLFKLLTTLFFLGIAWSIALSAHAAGPAESSAKTTKPVLEYEVKSGDTLGEIAIEHKIALEELMEINGIEDPDNVWAGRKLRMPGNSEHGKVAKRGVTIEVPKGFNLSRIATAYETPLAKIIQANKLTNPDRVQAGQKLLIPGATEVIELIPPPPCYKDPVTLYRVRTDETEEVSLVFCSGKTNPDGLDVLSKISGPPRKEMPFPLHPRLAQLIQRVSEKYPGKRIEIVSGQRLPKQKGNESYHNKGQAIDFRMEGISNKDLATFVRKFKNVGVGYYPNSVFIHMDTREKDAYWVDYSRPGEKAIYAKKGMTDKDVEQIREKRQEKKTEKITAEVKSRVDELVNSLAMNTD